MDDPAEADQERSIFRKKRSRPREHDRQRHAQRQLKRLKSAYCNEYRQELNSAIAHAQRPGSGAPLDLQDSQIGLACWTADEKASFFSALDRHGRANLESVAQAVGSKTLLEVAQFHKLLESGAAEAMAEHVQVEAPPSAAAAEISDECCDALELSADALLIVAQKQDEQREQAAFGDRWSFSSLEPEKLTASSSATLNDTPLAILDQHGDNSLVRRDKALTLLNVPNLLELAEDIFMYGPEGGLYYLDTVEHSAIYASAAISLRDVVLDVTRQLVSASLFHAMARARASARNNTRRAKGKASVRQSDVLTAVDGMSMPRDSVQFWKSLPRRLGLSVKAESRHSSQRLLDEQLDPLGQRNYLVEDYDAVEQLLSPQDVLDEPPTEVTASIEAQEGTSSGDSPPPAEDIESVSGSEEGLNVNARAEETDDPNTSLPESPLPTDAEPTENPVDVHLEALDQANSATEEARLWSLLGEAHPLRQTPGQPKSHEELGKAGVLARPFMQAQLDQARQRRLPSWRRSLAGEYYAPWERYDRTIPAEAFTDFTRPLTRQDFQSKRRRRSSSSKRTQGAAQSPSPMPSPSSSGTSQRSLRPRSTTPYQFDPLAGYDLDLGEKVGIRVDNGGGGADDDGDDDDDDDDEYQDEPRGRSRARE